MTDLVRTIREAFKDFGLLSYQLNEPGRYPLYTLKSGDGTKLAEIRVFIYPAEDFMLNLRLILI